MDQNQISASTQKIQKQNKKGKSRKDTIEAGNMIVTKVNMTQIFSFDVQERVMKVLAKAGMVQLASQILDSMVLGQYMYVPSSMSYVAVLNGLRRIKKLDSVRDTLEKLSNACRNNDSGGNVSVDGGDYNNISNNSSSSSSSNNSSNNSSNSACGTRSLDVVALNTYLGAISDVLTTKSPLRTISSPSSTTITPPKEELLMDAYNLLQPNVAKEKYSIDSGPDIISFNTVLNAAISMPIQNSTLINDLIQMMKRTEGIVEDIYTYNLRLKACGTGTSTTGYKIMIIDEILAHPTVRPDKFTIEQSLLPLAREGRIGDILELLRDFNFNCVSTRIDPLTVSNAYSTFLIALVKVRIHQTVFEC